MEEVHMSFAEKFKDSSFHPDHNQSSTFQNDDHYLSLPITHDNLLTNPLQQNHLGHSQEPWFPLNSLLVSLREHPSSKGSEKSLPPPDDEINDTRHLWGLTKQQLMKAYKNLPKGLEFYQAVARPRLLDDPHMLEFKHNMSSTQLRDDLSCPICKGILQKPVVPKKCIHRFCSNCIEKCFRIGIKDCPQCRNHVPTRRCLRDDPIFEQIIQRLFADVEAFEDQNDYILLESNKRLCVKEDDEMNRHHEMDLNEHYKHIYHTENHNRFPSPSPSANYYASPLIHSSGYMQSDVSSHSKSGLFSMTSSNECLLVNDSKLSKAEKRRKRRDITNHMKKIPFEGLLSFELIPDPVQGDLPQLKHDNKLKTTGHFSVQQLGRFLSFHLNLSKDQSVKFYTKNHKTPFEPHCSLAYVHHRSYAFSHETIVLYYTLRNYGDPNGGTLKGNRGHVPPSNNISPAN